MALSIFGYAATSVVLRAHRERPQRTCELVEGNPWLAESSLRTALQRLQALGALRRPESLGDHSRNELSQPGRELLLLATELERWLAAAPGGPVGLDSDAGRAYVRAIVSSWDTSVLRAVAEGPVSLAEVSAAISGVRYPVLKRRVAKLRSMKLIERVSQGREPIYVATDWLRRATAPLAVAARWELRHHPGARPPDCEEVEACFLLAVPLLELPSRAHGKCALAVALPREDGSTRIAGIVVAPEHGRLVASRLRGEPSPPTWALGAVEAWMDAAIAGDLEALRINGAHAAFGHAVVTRLHRALFHV